MRRILVDGGSFADILYYSAFKKMGLDNKDLKKEDISLEGFTCDSMDSKGNISLEGFTCDSMDSKGTITLDLVLGKGSRSLITTANILFVDVPSAYNAILGPPTVNGHGIIP